MAELCVDVNIAVRWFFDREPHRNKARRFLRDAKNGDITLIAPPLFEMELDGVVLTRFAYGEISRREVQRLWSHTLVAPVVITSHARLRQRARQLALEFGQRKVYDATYAALAELRGCDFWTADRAFYDAVRDELDFVYYLPDYPG